MSKAEKQVIPLVIMSIVMFASLLFGMKIGGIGLLLWVITVFWTMNKTMFAHFKPSELVEANTKIVEESFGNKEYLKSGIHLIAVPMVAIGLIWVFITIFCMIFIF